MDNDRKDNPELSSDTGLGQTDGTSAPETEQPEVAPASPFADDAAPTADANKSAEAMSPFADDVPAEQASGAQVETAPVVEEPTAASSEPTEAAPAIDDYMTPGLDWYVIRIATGYEKFVESSIRENIAIENMQDAFGEIMVPTEEVVEIRAGQKRKSRRKFFPGYMLIQMKRDEAAWHLVKNITHVLGFVGGRRDKLPVPLTNKEIGDIIDRVRLGEDKPRPKVLFEAGEVVRIIDGPFADFDGVVEEVNYEKSRLKISVSLFGRSTPVELEFTQVEKSN